MTVFATSQFPTIDPRAEFWSELSRWPRNTVHHIFLGDVVLDLGKLLFRDAWTDKEPATVLLYPIRPVLDTATSSADIEIAVHILYSHHAGFRARADVARASGQPSPLPTTDE